MPETNRQTTHYLNGCTIILDNEVITTGGENDFIKLTPVEPRNTYNQTANGGTQRNRHDSDAYDFEITFMKSDRRLHKLLQDRFDRPPPLDEFRLTIVDKLKAVVANATQCTIADRPELVWGKEGGELKVKGRTPNLKHRFVVET